MAPRTVGQMRKARAGTGRARASARLAQDFLTARQGRRKGAGAPHADHRPRQNSSQTSPSVIGGEATRMPVRMMSEATKGSTPL